MVPYYRIESCGDHSTVNDTNTEHVSGTSFQKQLDFKQSLLQPCISGSLNLSRYFPNSCLKCGHLLILPLVSNAAVTSNITFPPRASSGPFQMHRAAAKDTIASFSSPG